MNDLPPNLEADLLALIEGQPLSAAQRAAIDAALAADPALSALVRSGALESDRAQLRALGDVRAPAELLTRVETMLEREALLELSAAEQASEPAHAMPISRIQPQGPSIWSIVTRSPWARPLAVAAGIALVAGVSLLMFSQRKQPGSALSGREVATGEAARPTPPTIDDRGRVRTEGEAERRAAKTESAVTPGDPLAALAEPPSPGTRIESGDDKAFAVTPPAPLPMPARSTPPGGGTASRAMDASFMAQPEGMTQNSTGSLSRAFSETAGDRDDAHITSLRKQDEGAKDASPSPDAQAKTPELTNEAALRLAAAGRLAIRVTAATTDDGLRTVRAVHTKVARVAPAEDLPAAQFAQLQIVTDEALPKTLLDLAKPDYTRIAKPLDAVTAGASTAAAPRTPAQLDAQAAPLPAVTSDRTTLKSSSTLSLRLPADADSLAALLRSLRSASTSAQFIELRAPVGMGVNITPIDVTEIVWWTQPPAAWIPRMQVPVIVEQKP